MQNQSSDHNISKRSRSPTLSYEDADGTKAHVNTGGNSRRYRMMFVFSGVI
jgi:nuclear mRNA export protein SAC3